VAARTGHPQAPGLRWRRGSPAWLPPQEAIAAGYRPSRVALDHLADRPELLKARCAALNADLRLWLAGYRDDPAVFDGSLRNLLVLYQQHPESSYQALRPWTQATYASYLSYLRATVGERPIESITGLDLVRWQRDWTAGGVHLAKAMQLRTVLLSASRFGASLRAPGCAEFATVIRETRRGFGRPRPRDAVLTATDVAAARKAAHAAGRPSRAMVYAIVYETTLRLYDVIGRWWPADRAPASEVVDGQGRLWVGLCWEDIDDDLVLRYVPSKTAGSTGLGILYPLATAAPMVMQELRHHPLKRRAGPLIVNERTGLPYTPGAFQRGWREDRAALGLDNNIWARDMRASGITEARAGGAALDDAGKVAGHAGTRTTGSVYDRAALEAAERFAAARLKLRAKRRR
jgi:hypothetical protein